MEIYGLRALVTGASGFIGGRLAQRLATEEGVHVHTMVVQHEKGGTSKKVSLGNC
jgi:nucleoside-diphosphate-sugar epimerase